MTVHDLLAQATLVPKETLKPVVGEHWVKHRNKHKDLPTMRVVKADHMYVVCVVWEGYPMCRYLRRNVKTASPPLPHQRTAVPQPWTIEVEHAEA